MINRVIIAALFIAPLMAKCQYQYIGTPQNVVLARAGLMADSSFYLGIHDTTFIPYRIGCIVQRPQDNLLYEYNTFSGHTHWYPLFIVLANNGLSKSGDTVQLGGTLIKNTTVDGTPNYTMTFTGSQNVPNSTVAINNTGSGHGMVATASGAGYGVYGIGFRGVYGSSSDGRGVHGNSTTGIGLYSDVTTGTPLSLNQVPTSFNDVKYAATISRATSGNSGLGASGVGTGLIFAAPTTTLTTPSQGGTIEWMWSNATNASRTGRFTINLVNNAAALDTVLELNGDGDVTTYGSRHIGMISDGGSSLALGDAQFYSFTGTTATWTLPAVAGTKGLIYYIKNRGSGAVTLNANGGNNEIYTTSAVNTYSIAAGDFIIICSDGVFFDLKP